MAKKTNPRPLSQRKSYALCSLVCQAQDKFFASKKGLTNAHKSFFFLFEGRGRGKGAFLNRVDARYVFATYRRGFAPPPSQHFERSYLVGRRCANGAPVSKLIFGQRYSTKQTFPPQPIPHRFGCKCECLSRVL